MHAFGSFLFIAYVCGVIGVVVFAIIRFARFVDAHERIASAIENAARNWHRKEKGISHLAQRPRPFPIVCALLPANRL